MDPEIKNVPGTSRLLLLGAGVLFFHVLNAVLQEAVFHLPGFHHTVALTCLQTFGIAVFAFIELQVRLRSEAVKSSSPTCHASLNPADLASVVVIHEKSADVVGLLMSPAHPVSPTHFDVHEVYGGCLLPLDRRVPLRTYFLLSLLSTLSALLTNHASHLLNYPTQVVFKSSKLFFVMSIRVMLNMAKKKTAAHIRREFLSCLMIVAGLVFFTYGTSKKVTGGAHLEHGTSSYFNAFYGVVAIVIALCCDAFLYIGEEKYCFDEFNARSGEVILFTYGFSAVNSFVALIATGGLLSSIEFSLNNPVFPFLVAGFSVCNFCGTHFLLGVVSEFDSNVAVIVTSTRKMFTVLLSFLIYPKPFTLLHFCGLIGVSAGVIVYEHARVSFKKIGKITK